MGLNIGGFGVYEAISWWKESGMFGTGILDRMHLLVMFGDKGVTMERCMTRSLLKSKIGSLMS